MQRKGVKTGEHYCIVVWPKEKDGDEVVSDQYHLPIVMVFVQQHGSYSRHESKFSD